MLFTNKLTNRQTNANDYITTTEGEVIIFLLFFLRFTPQFARWPQNHDNVDMCPFNGTSTDFSKTASPQSPTGKFYEGPALNGCQDILVSS